MDDDTFAHDRLSADSWATLDRELAAMHRTRSEPRDEPATQVSWKLAVRDRGQRTWHAVWQADGPRAEQATRARFDEIVAVFTGGLGAVHVGESWAAVRLMADTRALAEQERTHWPAPVETRPTLPAPAWFDFDRES